jgi:hypothetical protein
MFNLVRVRIHLMIMNKRKMRFGMRINKSKYRILRKEDLIIPD